jgi:type IX secretion system substrate protein
MKKILLPSALFLFLTLQLFSQVWESQAEDLLPPNYSVADISIVNDEVIWATAIDFGTAPAPANFVSILLKSTDGGDNWDTLHIEEAMGRWCMDIHAFDENTACVTSSNRNGSNSEWGIYRTTDGGVNWTEEYSGQAGGGWIHFFDEMEGVSGFGDVAITDDGGMSWTEVIDIPPYQSGEQWGGNIFSNMIGTSHNSVWFGTSHGRVFQTENKGNSWTVNESGLGANTFLYSFGFIDEENGLAVYDDGPSSSVMLARTTDGQSWESIGSSIFMEVDAIPCSNTFIGMNYELNEEVFAISSDHGSNWEVKDNSKPASGAVFLNPEIGWLPGSGDTAIYKWSGNTLNGRTYVNQSANGNNDGTSWVDAYTDLQVALDSAEAGDEIWVAEGTYLPGSDPNATFLIDKDLKLYGGFAGMECNLSERDIVLHPTILSGDVIGDDVSDDFVNNRDDNLFTVIDITSEITNETLIDGFTISNGHADGLINNQVSRGAGIHSLGSPIINNCFFTQNYASIYGAGAYFWAGTFTDGVSVEVNNCRFEKNKSDGDGGGLMMDTNGQNPTFTVTSCEFSENMAESNGGGARLLTREDAIGTTFLVDSCLFELNNSTFSSGLLTQMNGVNNQFELKNSTFLKNEAELDATVIVVGYGIGTGNATVDSCIFDGNTSGFSGAIEFINNDNSEIDFILSNSTLTDNEGKEGGAIGIYPQGNGKTDLLIENCEIENNVATTRGGGIQFWQDAGNINVTISKTKILNNQSPKGGAIDAYFFNQNLPFPDNVNIVLENTLIAQNSSNEAAINLSELDSFIMINCTVAGNQSKGIGISNGTKLTLQNTILHNNGTTEFEALTTDVTVTSYGGNLIGDSSLVDYALTYDLQNTDPLLDAEYYPIAPNSPAIDNGVDLSNLPPTDLDGNERPYMGGCVDIGAYESDVIVSTECVTNAKEVIVGEVNLSPNPAIDFIRLQLPESITQTNEISVFDAHGRLVERHLFTPGQAVQVGHLPSGFYTLKLADGEQVYIGRFLKQ